MKKISAVSLGLIVLFVFAGCTQIVTIPTKTVDKTIIPKKSCK